MGDQSLEKFRVEYEKLHQALKKSHESEKRLMEKCRELNAEIVANSAKVTTALKLSQGNHQLPQTGLTKLYTHSFQTTLPPYSFAVSLELNTALTQCCIHILLLCFPTTAQEIEKLWKMVDAAHEKDGLNRRLRAAEEMKAELESKRESLKQQIGSIERGRAHHSAIRCIE